MRGKIEIEWLEPEKWKNKRQMYPMRQIYGNIVPGAEVQVSFGKRRWKARIVGVQEGRMVGQPPASEQPAKTQPGESGGSEAEKSDAAVERDADVSAGPSSRSGSGMRWRKRKGSKKGKVKKARLAGKEYTSRHSGKVFAAKKLTEFADPCCKRNKCSENFSAEDRERIFNHYYGLDSYKCKADFILQHVTPEEPQSITAEVYTPENCQRRYH